MISRSAFLEIVRDELQLPLAESELVTEFDQFVHWESLQVLRLVMALERETGTRLPVSELITEQSLEGIYQRVIEAENRQ
ncbi:acyl carrier protein [Streptomyces sp. APSN-46.1]|uniref:acyl carrier protein n=1 Tax=Streptomyces sp. APSN-46.1 TaxID=2929049 RepID=UPI001FB24A73|nr:acyl carrier protein [Streptomyces sp. APSN-46.1]MCJ1681143.1 acyl carrier protein [Streptomyces sp. APSN-46.1]